MRTLIVTGASGYIGRHLLAAGRAAGWRVVAATRRPVAVADAWLSYRLEDEIVADSIPRDAVIVHLAAQTGGPIDAAVEIEAARQLVALAPLRNARLIFVSSQTARPDAPTPYGRTKWAIEQLVVEGGGTVVRPGLVYGGSPGGVYAALLRLVQENPVLPSLLPAPRVQPVHVDDLTAALLHIAEHEHGTRQVFRIAAREPVRFDAFLRALAVGRGRRPPRFFPLPAAMVPLCASAFSAIGAPALAARLRSLVDLPVMVVDDATQSPVVLRTLAQGVARAHPHRRAVIAEGVVLLRYVLGARPALVLLRRYLRWIERSRNGRALALPSWLFAWPAGLRMLDQRAWLERWPELDGRLAASTAIAEASPEGANRFLAIDRKTGPLIAMLRLAGVGVAEGLARVGGWPMRALVRPRDDG